MLITLTCHVLVLGDEVLQWNGKSLPGATKKEVYNIILESKPEPQVELVVSRPIGYECTGVMDSFYFYCSDNHKCLSTKEISMCLTCKEAPDALSLFTEISQESQNRPTLLWNLVSAFSGRSINDAYLFLAFFPGCRRSFLSVSDG